MYVIFETNCINLIKMHVQMRYYCHKIALTCFILEKNIVIFARVCHLYLYSFIYVVLFQL